MESTINYLYDLKFNLMFNSILCHNVSYVITEILSLDSMTFIVPKAYITMSILVNALLCIIIAPINSGLHMSTCKIIAPINKGPCIIIVTTIKIVYRWPLRIRDSYPNPT